MNRKVNIQSVDDISDLDRGLETTKVELRMMLSSSKGDQKSVYHSLIYEMQVNSVAFVSGAAGTGKSYILRMLERYYKLKGYKVINKKLISIFQNIHSFFILLGLQISPNRCCCTQHFRTDHPSFFWYGKPISSSKLYYIRSICKALSKAITLD